MTRDFSQFFSGSSSTDLNKRDPSFLESLGWSAYFSQQTSLDQLTQTPPVRVIEAHRTQLHVLGDGIDTLIPQLPDVVVGDWLLLDLETPTKSEPLDRKSLIKRRAPGTGRSIQLIAANVDTVFIVSSCNQDFNLARLERYVALAFEAEVTPVILLTKSDLCVDPAAFVQQAQSISDQIVVLALNAKDTDVATQLTDWRKPGQTLAFLGSSGVGKSTLVNALTGENSAETGAIREDDAKGRHTTTRRQLHQLPGGGMVLDTPGMRELQLTDANQGVASVFADLTELAHGCRFRDCAHDTEPGCAIQAALAAGEIDHARLQRWKKLVAEEAFNAKSMLERKAEARTLKKHIRAVQSTKRR
ncbi:ribosome small subunit-dependent GTPase A [Rhodobacteraceae bacterium M382]|nr:ribosome small subunit-dependent GTPase A [Rhodobacteraceae bacterium M382]